MSSDIAAAITEGFPQIQQDLEALVRIPSVSAAGFDAGEVRRSAHATAEILEAAGLQGTRLLEVDGAHPAVFGHSKGPPSSPTVLLYAHHDVQPAGDPASWTSPPFEPVEWNGRLFGRGSADDKSGIAIHAGVLRTYDHRPPVGIKAFIEGEEETGSAHLPEFLRLYGELLEADVILVADMASWDVGVPTITTSLRGLVDCTIEVRTLEQGVHSGGYGGLFPDALTVLCRALASLHDEQGRVAVAGLVSEPDRPVPDRDEQELRRLAGALAGTQLISEGSLNARRWTMPAVSVLAIDAPRVEAASNTLIPSARAKVSMRLAPGEDPDRAMHALVEHLRAHTPWGAEVEIVHGSAGRPFAIETGAPAFESARAAFEEAYGRPVIEQGGGGSIPIVAELARAFPDATIVPFGAGDPTSRAHGPDESVDLGDVRRATLAEALLLQRLAGRGP